MATLAKGLAVLGTFDKAAADHDAVASGASDRTVSGDSATHLAHPDRAWICRAKRPAVLALIEHSQAGLCLSRDPELDRAGDAADAAAQRAVPRIVLGGDPRGNRNRLRRAHSGRTHYVGDARGGHAATRLPHLARAGAARFSRPRGNLAATDVVAARRLIRRRRSPTSRRCSTACRKIARKDFPLSTRNWNAACARSRYRSSTATAKRSQRSI